MLTSRLYSTSGKPPQEGSWYGIGAVEVLATDALLSLEVSLLRLGLGGFSSLSAVFSTVVEAGLGGIFSGGKKDGFLNTSESGLVGFSIVN